MQSFDLEIVKCVALSIGHLLLWLLRITDCHQLKRNYVLESLERYKHDPTRLWKTIRTFWPGKKAKSSKINNNNGQADSYLIAETLNKHFQ